MLKIDIKENNSEARIVLEGKLDVNTSKDLKARLTTISDNAINIDMDIENLVYISSAGLRVILQLHNQLKERSGKLTVFHPREMVMEVFEDTGLSDYLNINK